VVRFPVKLTLSRYDCSSRFADRSVSVSTQTEQEVNVVQLFLLEISSVAGAPKLFPVSCGPLGIRYTKSIVANGSESGLDTGRTLVGSWHTRDGPKPVASTFDDPRLVSSQRLFELGAVLETPQTRKWKQVYGTKDLQASVDKVSDGSDHRYSDAHVSPSFMMGSSTVHRPSDISVTSVSKSDFGRRKKTEARHQPASLLVSYFRRKTADRSVIISRL
jgi:hypothetical protein